MQIYDEEIEERKKYNKYKLNGKRTAKYKQIGWYQLLESLQLNSTKTKKQNKNILNN